MAESQKRINGRSNRAGISVDAISAEIDRVAEEIRQNKKRGRLDPKALGQLDELTELLRQQHTELQVQTDEVSDLLDACQDELNRAQSQTQRVERLRSIQSHDRKKSRRDAA